MRSLMLTILGILMISAAGMASDTCPGDIIVCDECITGTTVGLADDFDCGEGHNGPDAVYMFTLTDETSVTIIGEGDYADAD